VAKFRELFQTRAPTTVTVTLNQKSDRHPQLYIDAEKGLIVTLIKEEKKTSCDPHNQNEMSNSTKL